MHSIATDPFSFFRIASSLSPEDPEIAFNLAAVFEASEFKSCSLYHY
jgi:hypothetical protein